MNEIADQQLPTPRPTHRAPTVTVSPAYAAQQLARALRTSETHPDEATRARAEGRTSQWRAVLEGIAGGRLDVGSRTPVAGLPAWVTPEVVRGGFATGTSAAAGPLTPHEEEAARRAGVPATRADLFAHALTAAGLADLWALLDSGRYEVTLPEESALLTVAWLVRADDIEAAAALVAELQPFADRLRFLPRPVDRPSAEVGAMHRRTVGEVSAQLAQRQPKAAVEAQREALTVWRPFEDELLSYWLRHGTDATDAVQVVDATDVVDVAERADRAGRPRTAPRGLGERQAEAAALLERYHRLAAAHPRCGKHRNPKSNAGILRRALEETAAGRPVPPRPAGLLRHAVRAMVAKRGVPGSARHTRLREVQARQAALPSHHHIAALVVQRLAGLDQHQGTPDVESPVVAVTAEEAAVTGMPAGTAVPVRLRAAVRSALSAPLETLVERGLVPSAEVLAELVPQVVAAATAERHPDPALRTLSAATYRAFRNRRSLLLLDLQHQVRVEELPWVRALAGHGTDADAAARARAAAGSALRRLGDLALASFPGTLLPNPLVRELSHLGRQAELSAPFVEELAADIFMGTFTPKFLTAARVAADLLEGTLYARYYGIDCAVVRSMAVVQAAQSLARKGQGARTNGQPATAAAFAELCAERAARARTAGAKSASGGSSWAWSPAANGTVIEQAQILTTHNLAVLVDRAGVAPSGGWEEPARACFATVCRLVGRVHGHPRPLGTVKDAAYAWRQMLFHLSLCPPDRQAAVVEWVAAEAARQPWHVAARLGPAVAGLRMVAAGGEFGPDGTAHGGLVRRFLGWTTEGHWMCRRPAPAATSA
ncbi:hypothetical protein [Streptomyces sp. WAC06614]|uniref:hypothetical protein n=1 Tax=Streptomyces sp. WAC06614 TaxID=2487416 RepID=UPI000F7B5E89|nr:hypothetical protein [Streptomyces sp. WAC06614]RSS80017.1 hypothetical protein EF918_15150 [Streptomyces sp. WAC06614]